ncbi:MAG: transposase [Aphanocapsa sp. GSE-SYN-MK-11-07L]|jgi:transposase|nr:transposase [Aphanocapsa sp. GSE-SYN-MK-11-07L]
MKNGSTRRGKQNYKCRDCGRQAAGCQVVYLPPYSPDLNRIEKCWAWLKSRIRKLLPESPNLRDAMESVLKQAAS